MKIMWNVKVYRGAPGRWFIAQEQGGESMSMLAATREARKWVRTNVERGSVIITYMQIIGGELCKVVIHDTQGLYPRHRWRSLTYYKKK